MPLINAPTPEVDPEVKPLIGLPEEPTLSREVAAKRAQKYDLAMGDDSPGPDKITENILSGHDKAMRDLMATRKLLQQRAAKAEMLDEIAQTSGKTPTVEDLDFIYNLDVEKALIDPETAIEESYSRKALQGSLMGGFNFTALEDEQALHTSLDAAEESLTRKESFQRINEEYQAKYKNQDWLKYAGETITAMVPTVTANRWMKAAELILGDSGWTAGGNIDSMRDFIMAQSPAVGTRMVRKVAQALETESLSDALQFTEAMLSYSSSSQFFDNVMITGTDLATMPAGKIIGGVGRTAKTIKANRTLAREVEEAVTRGAADGRFDQVTLKQVAEATDTTTDARNVTPDQRVKRSVRDVLKSFLRKESNPEDGLAAAGHVEESAIVATIRNLKESMRTGLKPLNGEIGQLMDNVPSLWNPGAWLGVSSKAFTREMIQGMEQTLSETGKGLLSSLVSGLRIERLPESDAIFQAMVKQAREVSKLKYRELADRIVDARPAVATTPAGDVWQVGVRWGDEVGNLFEDVKSATIAAEEMGLAKYQVGQQGSKYFLETYQAVDETAPEIRSLLVTTENTTPRSLPGMWINALKSAEDLVAPTAMADRKAATYGVSRLEGMAMAAAKRIGKLGKKSREDLRVFLDNDRRWSEVIQNADGTTQQVEGRFAQNLADLETRWYENFGRYPTEAETIAYLEYVRLSDLDWAFRNFRVLRDKSRLGVELHDIKLRGVPNHKGGNEEVFFDGIEAKAVQEVNFNHEAGILVLQDEAAPIFFRTNSPGMNPKEMVENWQNSGYTLLRVSPFGERTLKANPLIHSKEGLGAAQDEAIHYVLALQSRSRPLPIQQLPYRPGAHRLYQDGWYIGQPKITRLDRAEGTVNRYDYDRNIMMFGNEAKARKFAERYEKVRQMLRDGVGDLTINAYIKDNLSKSPDEIKGLFYPKYDDDGQLVAEAMLSLDDSIGARFTGTRLSDSMNLSSKYENFRHGSDDVMNLYTDLNKDFIGGRDPVLETIEEAGTEANPIYKTVDAKMVDVFSTLNKGVRQMFDARYMDDIKIKEMEKFIQEFGHTLRATPEELATNPTKHLFDPKWNDNIDQLELQAAKNSLMSLKQFLGVQTESAKKISWLKQKLASAVYNKFGDSHIPILSNFLLYTTKDPLAYARGVAFHTKLGLFNPVQLFLQGQTYFHMSAIVGPKLALQAGPTAVLTRLLRFTDNEEIIRNFASKAKAFGINEHDFVELYKSMREAGIDRIGGEVAMRDTLMEPKLVGGATGKFLEWGTTFFDEGERFVRTSAYTSAYLEWRGANPTAKLTNAQKLKILNRADLLSGNMTRASNASWQRGLASIPTQFFAYQFRIMEQLLGKRLGATTQERAIMRARILGTYGMLYGLPVSAGAVTAVWPWTDTVRKELIQRGIDYDDNVLTRGLVDGFASVLLEGATGLKTNIGQRYGPGGLNVLQDFFSSDTYGAELFFGVSGSSLKSMAEKAFPLLTDMRDIMMGESDKVPILAEDLMDAFKEISSVNNAIKTMYGINYGKLISKNEIQMTDITPAESWLMGLWGLQPQEVDDAFTKGTILKEEGEARSYATKEAKKWFQRALRETDPDLKLQYLKKGRLQLEGGGLDWRDRARVFRDVMNGVDTYVESTNKKFSGSTPERQRAFIQDQIDQRQATQ